MASDKEREQRISRLSRMAGNIAAGMAGDPAPGWASGVGTIVGPLPADYIAQRAVSIALAIDAEVQRVCAPKEPTGGEL